MCYAFLVLYHGYSTVELKSKPLTENGPLVEEY